MNVLFLYHNIDTRNLLHYPFGVGILSAYLKRAGHDCKMLFVQNDISQEELSREIRNYSPDLVAFSTVTLQWRYTQKYAARVKAFCDLPVICGGHHPTFMPEEVIADPNIDMICIGEGGEAIVDVVRRLESGGDLTTIPNVWYKDGSGRVHKNDVRPLVPDLNDEPFTDRDILPFQDLIDSVKSEPNFISSRGCPYSCRYCSNSAIKNLYRGKGVYVRHRSPENMIQEIRAVREKYTFDRLMFFDEAFGVDKDWIERFCDIYKAEFGYPFGAMVRAETMSREKFQIMSRAGLKLIFIGVESGNPDLRRHVMNRKMSNETIIQTCRDAQAEGIQIWTFNMVGVPGETVDTINETMELNRIINPNYAWVSIFQPFPGTPLYDECREKGYIVSDFGTNFHDKSVLALPTISTEDLLRKYKEFQDFGEEIKNAHAERGERIFLVDV